MSSGRKERVLISCVSFEVAKIVNPAVHYEATKVHLIHYGRGIYQEFYDEVQRRIREELPRAEIIEHSDDPIFSFERMMNLVLRIIRREQKANKNFVEIYVNTSAGPSEYCAASLIASMMMEGTTPFNVSSAGYQISDDKVRELYFEEGRPVGMAKATNDPTAFSTYAIKRPDEKLVLGLGILNERIESRKPASAPAMIPLLAENGLMTYTKVNSGKPDQKSTMSYQRNFVDRWLENGWTEKVSKREMRITPEGRTILDVFLDSYRE